MNIKIIKQIDLTKRNGNKHDDIDASKNYFVNYDGNWIYGKFNKQWYGWSFGWFGMIYAGLKLDSFKEVWEVKFVHQKG